MDDGTTPHGCVLSLSEMSVGAGQARGHPRCRPPPKHFPFPKIRRSQALTRGQLFGMLQPLSDAAVKDSGHIDFSEVIQRRFWGI